MKLVTFQLDVTVQLPDETNPDNVSFAIPPVNITVLETQEKSLLPRKVEGAIVVSHTTSHVVDEFTDDNIVSETDVSPAKLS